MDDDIRETPIAAVVDGWVIERFAHSPVIHITGPKPNQQDACIDADGDLVLDVLDAERSGRSYGGGDNAGARYMPVVVVEAAVRMWREGR
jgi:hypothetical protein